MLGWATSRPHRRVRQPRLDQLPLPIRQIRGIAALRRHPPTVLHNPRTPSISKHLLRPGPTPEYRYPQEEVFFRATDRSGQPRLAAAHGVGHFGGPADVGDRFDR